MGWEPAAAATYCTTCVAANVTPTSWSPAISGIADWQAVVVGTTATAVARVVAGWFYQRRVLDSKAHIRASGSAALRRNLVGLTSLVMTAQSAQGYQQDERALHLKPPRCARFSVVRVAIPIHICRSERPKPNTQDWERQVHRLK